MTNSHRKEYPFAGYAGFGGGAGALSYKSVASKTYRDDVFSTYLYKGNASAQYTAHQIVNGIDNSKHGGLVWIKNRTYAQSNTLLDTERVNGSGQTAELYSDTDAAQAGPYAGYNITAFNNNGFKLEGNGTGTNRDVDDYVAWNFRKAPGFFDIVTYTGTGSARTISHSLGSVPGCIMIKETSGTEGWRVYHTSTGNSYATELHHITGGYSYNGWNNTTPTSTEFSLGTDSAVNSNGETYVAYLYAGGESTAATARSVDFDGTGDYLTVAGPGSLGTSTNFTMECWVYPNSTSGNQRIFTSNEVLTTGEYTQFRINAGEWEWNIGGSGGSWTAKAGTVTAGQWYHVALVRNGTNTSFYVNGVLLASNTNSHSVTISTLAIGGFELSGSSSENLNGKISNARFVNGTAVYTSSFRPPTEPLTSITNTTLLCCNNSSTTGSTVTPGTITAHGDPTASTDSPFDDPAGFVFGDAEDQNVIKCGVFTGNGSTAGPHIQVGWEPEFILFKVVSKSDPWYIADTTRQIVTDGANAGVDNTLLPSSNQAENVGNWNLLNVSSTGWQPTTADSKINGSGHTYIYIAIRRPDGYVGKPPALGTDVFNMDVGNDSATIPAFDSNFIVDYALNRKPATSFDWVSNARLTGPFEAITNGSAAETSGDPDMAFDSNAGYAKNRNDTYQSWMWKRHAGFDVVCYTGDSVAGRQMPHSLGVVPEMMWVKCRNAGEDWAVYHKGLNGGTDPEDYFLQLESTGAEGNADWHWNDTAPTSTVFTLGTNGKVNYNNYYYIAMLFASANDADGNPISKCGYYTGTGSSGHAITTGFQPRFVIIKCTSNASSDWVVLDTTRGWGSGNDAWIALNSNGAQDSGYEQGAPTSTGFTLADGGDINGSGRSYIYYAHA